MWQEYLQVGLGAVAIFVSRRRPEALFASCVIFGGIIAAEVFGRLILLPDPAPEWIGEAYNVLAGIALAFPALYVLKGRMFRSWRVLFHEPAKHRHPPSIWLLALSALFGVQEWLHLAKAMAIEQARTAGLGATSLSWQEFYAKDNLWHALVWTTVAQLIVVMIGPRVERRAFRSFGRFCADLFPCPGRRRPAARVANAAESEAEKPRLVLWL